MLTILLQSNTPKTQRAEEPLSPAGSLDQTIISPNISFSPEATGEF
jgi:hypothetical protein